MSLFFWMSWQSVCRATWAPLSGRLGMFLQERKHVFSHRLQFKPCAFESSCIPLEFLGEVVEVCCQSLLHISFLIEIILKTSCFKWPVSGTTSLRIHQPRQSEFSIFTVPPFLCRFVVLFGESPAETIHCLLTDCYDHSLNVVDDLDFLNREETPASFYIEEIRHMCSWLKQSLLALYVQKTPSRNDVRFWRSWRTTRSENTFILELDTIARGSYKATCQSAQPRLSLRVYGRNAVDRAESLFGQNQEIAHSWFVRHLMILS